MFTPKQQLVVTPLAPRRDPTLEQTDTIDQPDSTVPQRSFGEPFADTRHDFPLPGGSLPVGYPSTRTSAPSIGQPTVPAVSPIKPRKMR